MDESPLSASIWQKLSARIVPGYQVASGKGGDGRFPGGTLKMQSPFFKALGLNLDDYFPGTLNANIAPNQYVVRSARMTFKGVKWHPTEPAEDFSFFDVRLYRGDSGDVTGLVYYPHPETKPRHFQNPQVLELLLPPIEGLSYGDAVELAVRNDQIRTSPSLENRE